MGKLKLVVSDFHLGRGKRLKSGLRNPLEDFVWDHRFKEFLEYYSHGTYADSEIELIFNGDILNLLMTDYYGHYTVVLTERVSVEKLQAIIEGHESFFDSLKLFLDHPKRSLTYVIGNHDQEMMWPECKRIFSERLAADVQWKNTHYQVDGIHIEHGHQYETANRVDPSLQFLSENLPEPILNLPWGSIFAVQFITKLKQQRPVIDKVRPVKMLIGWSLVHDTLFSVITLFKLVVYFFSTAFTKNRYRQTSLKSTFKILKECSIVPDLTDAAKRILRTPDIHTVVFGHTHGYKQLQIAEGKQYCNTGTWNETLSLDLESYGINTKLTYLRVDYQGEIEEELKPIPKLRHWIGYVPPEADAIGF